MPVPKTFKNTITRKYRVIETHLWGICSTYNVGYKIFLKANKESYFSLFFTSPVLVSTLCFRVTPSLLCLAL
jgi:hypothetical protein